MKTSTLRQNLLTYMSGMTIALISAITLLISAIFYVYLFNSEVESSISRLTLISNQLNNYLQTTENYSKTIITSQIVQASMTRANTRQQPLDALEQVKLKSAINHIIQSSKIIDNVVLYDTAGTHIVSTSVAAFSRHPLEAEKSLTALYWTPEYSRDSTNQLQKLACIRPFYSIQTGQPLGYLKLTIDQATIYDIYQHLNDQTKRIHIIAASAQTVLLDATDDDFNLSSQQYQAMKRFSQSYTLTSQTMRFANYFNALNWYIVYTIDLRSFIEPMITLLIILLIIVILATLLSLFIAGKLSNTITEPVYNLIAHTQRVKQGDWQTLDVPTKDRDINRLFTEFNQMIEAQKQLQTDLLVSEKNKNKLSLELLQQQIKPHFLYNTLDNIVALAEIEETDKLSQLVMNLSTFYRQSLNRGLSIISLSEELAITRAYLNIMKIRQYNKFDYRIDCPKDLLNQSCLKLLLQPIVENSIYHGIKYIDEPGLIVIGARQINDDIEVTVEDNGKGVNSKVIENPTLHSQDSFGLGNVNDRLQLQYGNAYGLTIANATVRGCVVKLTMPSKGGS